MVDLGYFIWPFSWIPLLAAGIARLRRSWWHTSPRNVLAFITAWGAAYVVLIFAWCYQGLVREGVPHPLLVSLATIASGIAVGYALFRLQLYRETKLKGEGGDKNVQA